MLLIETLFHRGKPIGKIRQDINADQVTFEPTDGHKRLATRKWTSVTTCRQTVIKAYELQGARNEPS